jgi:hypothetical protein
MTTEWTTYIPRASFWIGLAGGFFNLGAFAGTGNQALVSYAMIGFLAAFSGFAAIKADLKPSGVMLP